jgi:hypothetical protein
VKIATRQRPQSFRHVGWFPSSKTDPLIEIDKLGSYIYTARIVTAHPCKKSRTISICELGDLKTRQHHPQTHPPMPSTIHVPFSFPRVVRHNPIRTKVSSGPLLVLCLNRTPHQYRRESKNAINVQVSVNLC